MFYHWKDNLGDATLSLNPGEHLPCALQCHALVTQTHARPLHFIFLFQGEERGGIGILCQTIGEGETQLVLSEKKCYKLALSFNSV